MRAQERLLRRLVGVGLRAEQGHAQPAEDRAMRLHAGDDRVAMPSFEDERRDRICGIPRQHVDGRCLHCILHVCPRGHFVTADRDDFTSSRDPTHLAERIALPTREAALGAVRDRLPGGLSR